MGVIAIALKRVLTCLFPTKKDTAVQMAVKTAYILLLLALGIAICLIADYFTIGVQQRAVVENSVEIWHDADKNYASRINSLKIQNSDFVAWLQVGELVDNPVYKAADNSFYRTHNSRCEKSDYGAVYMSFDDSLDGSDNNIVIYGNNMSDGSMFGKLSKLRNASAFAHNGYITLSNEKESESYAVFSVMLLTEVAADDNGMPFDFRRTEFESVYDFGKWRDEAIQRSIISTGENLEYGDKTLILVTETDDFEGARFVVMAKKIEDMADLSPDILKVKANENVRYPKIWYDEQGLTYPY